MKEFKTIPEQVACLYDDKKIKVDEEDCRALLERNYVSLINPYKLFFSNNKIDNKHVYPQENNFKEILRIAKLDDDVSLLIHKWIRYFEIKFKNVLFYELSQLYANKGDEFCIAYVDEIRIFLKGHCSKKNIPSFCPHYFEILHQKGRRTISQHYNFFSLLKHIIAPVSDELSYRKEVLNKIYENATGVSIKGVKKQTTSKLIKHYIGENKTVPLWILPSSLDLGDYQIIYQMAPDTVVKKVYNSFFQNMQIEKVTCQDVFRFAGYLQTIRKLRNTVNHYEPLIPYFASQLNNKQSNLKVTINFLKANFESSIIGSQNTMPEYINSTYNESERKALEYIKSILK